MNEQKGGKLSNNRDMSPPGHVRHLKKARLNFRWEESSQTTGVCVGVDPHRADGNARKIDYPVRVNCNK